MVFPPLQLSDPVDFARQDEKWFWDVSLFEFKELKRPRPDLKGPAQSDNSNCMMCTLGVITMPYLAPDKDEKVKLVRRLSCKSKTPTHLRLGKIPTTTSAAGDIKK
jgi:hypothetical protein